MSIAPFNPLPVAQVHRTIAPELLKLYPKTPEECIEIWIDAYRDYGALEKTLKGYFANAKNCINLMLDNEREGLPYLWSREDMRFIKGEWDEKGLKVKTQLAYHNAYCSIAKHFNNPEPEYHHIRWPSYDGAGRRWLELEQAKIVVNWPKSPLQDLGIELMLRMGRRRIENLRATVSDMYPEAADPYMVVDGKGHKKHTMPFAPTTYEIYWRWMDDRHVKLMEHFNDHLQQAEAVDMLFLYVWHGQLGFYEPTKGTGYDKAVTNAISGACGIKFSNHDLRRTFGRELHFTGGVDPIIIQGYYNHNSMDQTLWYIGADQKRGAEAIKLIPY